MYTHFYELN